MTIYSIAFRPDGRRIAVGGPLPRIKIYGLDFLVDPLNFEKALTTSRVLDPNGAGGGRTEGLSIPGPRQRPHLRHNNIAIARKEGESDEEFKQRKEKTLLVLNSHNLYDHIEGFLGKKKGGKTKRRKNRKVKRKKKTIKRTRT